MVIRRLLTIISGQPLPNYIAIAETQPDIVHCIVTKSGGMKQKLQALQKVISANFPNIHFHIHEVKGPHDPLEVWNIAYELLVTHCHDEWLLNRSAGTEQMRLPLSAAFQKAGRDQEGAFFVETEKGMLTTIGEGWQRHEEEFHQGINVSDYFALHGQDIFSGDPVNDNEKQLMRQLQKLAFDDVVSSCSWRRNGNLLAEYDAAATEGYRLYLFETKALSEGSTYIDGGRTVISEKQKDANVLHDIEKLAYSRAIFGGPFGHVFWLLSGSYQPKTSIIERMKALSITYLPNNQMASLVKQRAKYHLPDLKQAGA